MSELRQVIEGLLRLSTHERLAVFCWFCDACAEYVGPGETHRCTKDSAVYPPVITSKKPCKRSGQKPFWRRVQHSASEPPIEGQCNYTYPSGSRCGSAKWHDSNLFCWQHSPNKFTDKGR